jgi:oligosaccharide repeat unit polymerase
VRNVARASTLGPGVVGAGVCALLGFLTAALVGQLHGASKVELTVVALVVTLVLAAAGSIAHLPTRDWFHPLAFPFLYVALSMVGPLIYLVVLREPLNSTQPSDISITVVAVVAGTIVGFGAGILAGLGLVSRRPTYRTDSTDHTYGRTPDFGRLRLIGRAAFCLSLPMFLVVIVPRLGQPYGTGYVAFGLANALGNAANFLVFAGTICIVIANVNLRGRVTSRIDLYLFGAFAVIVLMSGGRGKLIAPFLFAFIIHHSCVRKVRFGRAFIAVAIVLIIFQGITGSRTGKPFFSGLNPSVQRILGSIDEGVALTAQLVKIVPSPFHYTHGTTYRAAVIRQLPGPIAVALLGPPTDTAAFVYRRLISFNNPNSGFGFSLPSEGYLNFGVAGAVGAAVLSGLIFGAAYRRRFTSVSDRPSSFLYPILVATLSYSFRSDALTEIKDVLYPMLFLWLAYLLSERRPRATSVASYEWHPPEPVGVTVRGSQ